ncbi:oxalate:formate antiporter [Plakobranchus ocellatus]|uniref:Oxalate:formate antiporter n=1 Tax=Plakobranchus ocellatus TaxID=259542 RepID=A0AAV4AKU4_9GAST|nr:oxalate:formate antiporter [Plakobranchus ocellatus]
MTCKCHEVYSSFLGSCVPASPDKASAGQRMRRRRKILAACFTLSLPGTLLYFGNLLPYLVSYYHAHTPRVYMHPLWIASGFQICRLLGVVSSSSIERRVGLMSTVALGGIVVCMSILTSYWAVAEPLALVFTFGLCYGFGSGIMFPMIAKAGLRHAAGRSRWNDALMAAGTPLGGLLYMIVAFLVINPFNKDPDLHHNHVEMFTDSQLISKVPHYFLVMACVTAVLVGLGVGLIHSDNLEQSRNPEEYAGEFSDMEEMVLYAAQDEELNGYKEKKKAAQYGTLKQDGDQQNDNHENDSIKASEKQTLIEKSREYWLDYTNPPQATADESASRPERTKPKHNSCDQNEGFDMKRSGSYNKIGDEQRITATLIPEAEPISEEAPRDLSPSEVLNTTQFWILWFSALLLGHTQFIHENLYKQYGQREISNDAILLLPGLLGMVAIAVARPISFQACERVDTATTVLFMCASVNVLMTLMNVTINLVPALYVVCTVLEFAALSGVYVLHHLAPSRLFGQTYSGSNVHLVCTAPLLGSLAEPAIVQMLVGSCGWNWLFTSGSLTSALALCGLICVPYIQKSRLQ